MDTPPFTQRSQKPEPVGPIMAIVIIVLVFAVGGIYFFVKQYVEQQAVPAQTQEANAE